jgi:hypothetical protein
MFEPIDVSEWNKKPWYNTGGTRDKVYLESPEGDPFFFKRSLYKRKTKTTDARSYEYEFWNEIIAYHFGSKLGFDILKYDIGRLDGELGCLCKTMISPFEELVEGIKHINRFDPTFNPSNRKDHYKYSFQLIEQSLQKSGIHHFINSILEILVFDSLIGNGDRHQENWATINDSSIHKQRMFESNERKSRRTSHVQDFFRKRTLKKAPIRFAPIYDNGSCLGRELTSEKVLILNDNIDAIHRYIEKGPSEIHWKGTKISHFMLLKELMKTEHQTSISTIITRVRNKYSKESVQVLLNEIDQNVENKNKIPAERKRLIVNMIDLRFTRLVSLK